MTMFSSLVLAACLACVWAIPQQIPTFTDAYCGLSGVWPPPTPPKNAAPTSPGSDFELVQAQVFVRHGDRMIAGAGQCWPNDSASWACDETVFEVPTDDKTSAAIDLAQIDNNVVFRKMFLSSDEAIVDSNCEVGQLSKKGHLQHKENGRILREAYVDQLNFLSGDFNASEILLRADNSARVQHSVESLIEGMFPPSASSSAPSASTRVIDLFTRDEQYDNILGNANLCPGMTQLQAEAVKSPAFVEHVKQVSNPLWTKFASMLGFTAPDALAGDSQWDCLLVHLCHEQPVPAPMASAEDLFHQLKADLTWRYQYIHTYPNVATAARVTLGPLISEIWQRMQKADQTETKLFLTGGHDTTVIPLLLYLGIFDGNWVPYATRLQLEVWRNSTDGSQFVRATHDGQLRHFQHPCPVSSNALCPMEQFSELIAPLLPTPAECPCWPDNSSANCKILNSFCLAGMCPAHLNG